MGRLFLKTVLASLAFSVLITTQSVALDKTITPVLESQITANNSGVIATQTNTSSILRVTAVPTCSITASNVHLSSSVSISIKADAYIDCNVEQFRITYLKVTLHKVGLMPHYFNGPIVYSGNVYPRIRYWYQSFVMPCANFSASTYYSIATVKGYYTSDLNNLATGTSTSMTQNGILCGTNW